MSSSRKLRTSVLTGVLFVLAVGLLLFSTIGGTRAALTESATLSAELRTTSTGVETLFNNGERGLLALGEQMKPGKQYTESITVHNTSSIETYVRVDIYKYWVTNSAKNSALDPKMIELAFNTNDWTVTPSANGETVIAYYKTTLAPGATTAPLLNSVTVNKDVARTADANGVLLYEGASVQLQVQASVVQTHNASDAMLSAWGIESFPG